MAPEGASPDDLRQLLAQANADFRDKAPLSAADAAAIILDGVRSGAWRILVGEDAKKLDAAVRARPEAAYDYAQLASTPGSRGAGALTSHVMVSQWPCSATSWTLAWKVPDESVGSRVNQTST